MTTKSVRTRNTTLDSTRFVGRQINDPFVAQSEKPAKLGSIDLNLLTSFQRALLVMDGTVTQFIEAYTMEPVKVVRLSQSVQSLSADHVWLEAPEGAAVIARQVLLRGKRSSVLYAYAVSLIVSDRLPDEIKQGLETEDEALGHLLLRSKLEIRRELLWYGMEYVEDLPEAICHLAGKGFINRTYRIIVGGLPMMLINERFPLSCEVAVR